MKTKCVSILTPIVKGVPIKLEVNEISGYGGDGVNYNTILLTYLSAHIPDADLRDVYWMFNEKTVGQMVDAIRLGFGEVVCDEESVELNLSIKTGATREGDIITVIEPDPAIAGPHNGLIFSRASALHLADLMEKGNKYRMAEIIKDHESPDPIYEDEEDE